MIILGLIIVLICSILVVFFLIEGECVPEIICCCFLIFFGSLAVRYDYTAPIKKQTTVIKTNDISRYLGGYSNSDLMFEIEISKFINTRSFCIWGEGTEYKILGVENVK